MSLIKIHKLTINIIFIITFCSLIFVTHMGQAEQIIATAQSDGTELFEVYVVFHDEYGQEQIYEMPGEPPGSVLNFGTVDLDNVHGWHGANPSADIGALAIRVRYLFPAGTRGISICSNNADPYGSIAGMVNFDMGDWMQMCWRVVPQFPPAQKRQIFPVRINEEHTEVFIRDMIARRWPEHHNIKVDIDRNGESNEDKPLDFNGDGIIGFGTGPLIGLLADEPTACITEPPNYDPINEIYLGTDEEPHIGRYYAPFLYMIDNEAISLYGDDPSYSGDYPNAGYATVFDVVYGIQHAEGSFGDWAKNRELYVYPAANFDMADIVDITYTGTMDISFYSI